MELRWSDLPDNDSLIVAEIHAENFHLEEKSSTQSLNFTNLKPEVKYTISLYKKTSYNRTSVKVGYNLDPPLIAQCEEGNLTFIQHHMASRGHCDLLHLSGEKGNCSVVAGQRNHTDIENFLRNITGKG